MEFSVRNFKTTTLRQLYLTITAMKGATVVKKNNVIGQKSNYHFIGFFFTTSADVCTIYCETALGQSRLSLISSTITDQQSQELAHAHTNYVSTRPQLFSWPRPPTQLILCQPPQALLSYSRQCHSFIYGILQCDPSR